jgi:lysine 2,3-aminomutase
MTHSSAVDGRWLNFPSVDTKKWNDWRWQLRHRVTTISELEALITLSPEERFALENNGATLPFAITPYSLSLIDSNDWNDPLRRCLVPTSKELDSSLGEEADPLGEDSDMVVEGLVHRYPDRVLFLSTSRCATYCRYCTRSRWVGRRAHREATAARWERCFRYIEEHEEVRDVLISGGDPLTLDDGMLEKLLTRLRSIDHVELIRIGTKVPAVLPQRITPELLAVLKRANFLMISIHFAHPAELTRETREACEKLADAGLPLGSQTVLLKGINDDVATLRALFTGLLRCRVRPYYLYQCDPILGSAHFRTTVDKGLELIAGLRGHITGYAVPTYVIDAPGGGGKIPLLPETCVGREGDDLLLRNYEGKIFRYPDPPAADRSKERP